MEHIIHKCLQPNPEKRYQHAEDLHKELLHMQLLNETLIAQHRKKMIAILCSGAAASIALLAIGSTITSKRQNEITQYQELLLEAESAGDKGNEDEAGCRGGRAVHEHVPVRQVLWLLRQDGGPDPLKRGRHQGRGEKREPEQHVLRAS